MFFPPINLIQALYLPRYIMYFVPSYSCSCFVKFVRFFCQNLSEFVKNCSVLCLQIVWVQTSLFEFSLLWKYLLCKQELSVLCRLWWSEVSLSYRPLFVCLSFLYLSLFPCFSSQRVKCIHFVLHSFNHSFLYAKHICCSIA